MEDRDRGLLSTKTMTFFPILCFQNTFCYFPSAYCSWGVFRQQPHTALWHLLCLCFTLYVYKVVLSLMFHCQCELWADLVWSPHLRQSGLSIMFAEWIHYQINLPPFFRAGLGSFKKRILWPGRGVNKEHASGEHCCFTKMQSDHPVEGAARRGGCWEAVRRRLAPRGWGSLRPRGVDAGMGTLGLVWHIFECFYYLYKPKFRSVSGLKASLWLWIMNLNEAFCADYLMIHSHRAVTWGCTQREKKYRMFSGGIFDSWPFSYDLLFWDTQFEKQIVWSSVIDNFSSVWRNPCWQAWKKYQWWGKAFFLHTPSWSGVDPKNETLFGWKNHLLKPFVPLLNNFEGQPNECQALFWVQWRNGKIGVIGS